MAALAAAAVAPPPPAATQFDWHHPGKPDLTDPAVRATLPVDLRVALSDPRHRLVLATPCLDWKEVPGAAAGDPPQGMSLSQGSFDLLCTIGGVLSPWLRSRPNALLLSHVPEHGSKMFFAWVLVGGLDLDVKYRTLAALLSAVQSAKQACGSDDRLVLKSDAFFEDEARPAHGSGSAMDRAWMYELTGGMMCGAEDADTKPLALLRRAVEPKRKSAGRDLAPSTYCRFLQSLKSLSGANSSFIQDALQDSSTPNDEIAEYVAAQWRQLVESGYPFSLAGGMAQKNMELAAASSLIRGTDADKETAFKQMFENLLNKAPLVDKCVRGDEIQPIISSLLGNFEQLAGIILPGDTWCTAHCLRAVEHELVKAKLEPLIDSWGQAPVEILSNVRSHFKQERAASAVNVKLAATGDDGGKGGMLSVSGMLATRSPEYLDTKKDVAKCTNFLEGLDTMLASKSKVWYMKAIKQLSSGRQAGTGDEMETASKFVAEWKRYWPMAISRDDSGEVHEDVQGEEYPDQDVEALLDGEWHKVRWILLKQLMERWKDNIAPGSDDSYSDFATLHGVSTVMLDTMKLLKLARDGESKHDVCTCTGFMEHIRTMERRTRALPEGSAAREQAVGQMVSILMAGLKEFGERWSKQWVKPVNFGEDLVTSFADKKCFIMRRMDRVNKVSDTMHELREVLPVLFRGDVWEDPLNPSKPAMKPNPPAETPDQGDQHLVNSSPD